MQISGFSGRAPLPLPTPMASPPHFGYSRHTKKLFDRKLLVDGPSEDLQKIVDKGANVNARRGWRSSGATSLILLLWGKINETTTQKAEILLKAGADTEATTERFKKDPFRTMEGLAPPILKALQKSYIDLKLVNLLLEYGADPRTKDCDGLPGSARLGERSSLQDIPPVIIDTSKPGAWESRETIDPNSIEQKELRKALKEKVEAYAEFLNALEAKDVTRFLNVLTKNKALKLSPTDDPKLTITDRLLFNVGNLLRIKKVLGQNIAKVFLRECLNNPLDLNGFSKLNLGFPLSYWKATEPKNVKTFQEILGMSDKEIKKIIKEEMLADFERANYSPFSESNLLNSYKEKLIKSIDFKDYQKLEKKQELTEQEKLKKEELKKDFDSKLQKKMANRVANDFFKNLETDKNPSLLKKLQNQFSELRKKEQPQLS